MCRSRDGFRSDGTGVEDAVPEWLFQVIMIVYLALHVRVEPGWTQRADGLRKLGYE